MLFESIINIWLKNSLSYEKHSFVVYAVSLPFGLLHLMNEWMNVQSAIILMCVRLRKGPNHVTLKVSKFV